jgi:hypothetical protein
MKLFMKNAGTGRHPLHATRADHATLAGGIPVRHFALIHNGYGLKTAMGMFPYAAGLGGWGEAGRAGIVQQQKGAQLFAVTFIGKQGANRKTVTDPVGLRRSIDTLNFFHRRSPYQSAMNDRDGTVALIGGKIVMQRCIFGTINGRP